jgi:hypothetical protein
MRYSILAFLLVGIATAHKHFSQEPILYDRDFLAKETVADVKDINDIADNLCIYSADKSFYNFIPLIKKEW